jgi:hypothetical protein
MTEPLRIGILGASRIAELSIVKPAAATGHRLVAVAARDEARALDFISSRVLTFRPVPCAEPGTDCGPRPEGEPWSSVQKSSVQKM